MKKIAQLVTFTLVLAMSLTVLPAFAEEATQVVNINEADASQLSLLPRVGPALAQRIIDFREGFGPFRSAEDLLLVQGIGEKTFALMKDYVVTEGDTTLAEKVRIERRKRNTEEADSALDE